VAEFRFILINAQSTDRQDACVEVLVVGCDDFVRKMRVDEMLVRKVLVLGGWGRIGAFCAGSVCLNFFACFRRATAISGVWGRNPTTYGFSMIGIGVAFVDTDSRQSV